MPKPPHRSKAVADRPPLDEEGLRRLALDYLARYATTRAKLEDYLRGKLRERGGPAGAVAPIAGRMVDLGYIDDRAFGAQRAGALSRRGYGARRIAAALATAGVARQDAEPVLADIADEAWEAAVRFARRRRLGPYAPQPMDQDSRRRAFAALARAGHPPALAGKLLGMAIEELED